MPARLSRVRLRVRDTQRSAAFYRDLFGLAESAGAANGDRTETLLMRGPRGAELPELVLAEGIPPGEYVAGLEHVCFEVSSAEDVTDIYDKATGKGYQATQPRHHGGHWQTFIFDPDGYKVEVFTRDSNAAKRMPGS
jgi:catechol 2,3-dioxygenase-like lactoylglutathione lyase family enzyme